MIRAITKENLGRASIPKSMVEVSVAFSEYGHDLLSIWLKLVAADPPSIVIDC